MAPALADRGVFGVFNATCRPVRSHRLRRTPVPLSWSVVWTSIAFDIVVESAVLVVTTGKGGRRQPAGGEETATGASVPARRSWPARTGSTGRLPSRRLAGRTDPQIVEQGDLAPTRRLVGSRCQRRAIEHPDHLHWHGPSSQRQYRPAELAQDSATSSAAQPARGLTPQSPASPPVAWHSPAA